MFLRRVFLCLHLHKELYGNASESEGLVPLPAWSGRRHEVPLLQSSGHLCCTRALPQCLSVCLSCTACIVPGLVLAHVVLCLFIYLT